MTFQAVAAHRAVQPLEVAVDHEDQVVQLLIGGDTQGAGRFRLVGLAIAQKRPNLARGWLEQPPLLQIPHEARLVDGVDRPQPHRDRRKLPEIRHQPGMRVRGQARVFAQLVTEVLEMLVVEPPLQVGPRVDTRRGVPLEVDQIPGLVAIGRAKEVVEAHFDQGGERGVGGDVAADAVVVIVGPHHHGQGVPADQALQPPLQGAITRIGDLLLNRNGVHVGRVDVVGRRRPGDPGPVRKLVQQKSGPGRTGLADHLVQRLQPFAGLLRVEVLRGRYASLEHIGEFYTQNSARQSACRPTSGARLRSCPGRRRGCRSRRPVGSGC
jgi:hypothetical protein